MNLAKLKDTKSTLKSIGEYPDTIGNEIFKKYLQQHQKHIFRQKLKKICIVKYY